MNHSISALRNSGCMSSMVHAYDDGTEATGMLNVYSFPNTFGRTTNQVLPINVSAGAITYTWSNSAKTITASSGSPFSALSGTQTFVYDTILLKKTGGDFATFTYIGDSGELNTVVSTILDATSTVLTFPSSISLTRNRVVTSISIDGNYTPSTKELCLASVEIYSDTALDFVIQDGFGVAKVEIDVIPSISRQVISFGPIGLKMPNGMQMAFVDKTGLVTTHNATAIVTYRTLS